MVVYRNKLFLFLALCGLFLFLTQSISFAENLRKERFWPPEGKSEQYKVTRDTWVSGAKGERNSNNGGAGKLKLKGQQEFILIDIDAVPLKGKIITGALLHFRSLSSGGLPFSRLGVSSLAGEWGEGTSKKYHPQQGSSCFIQAKYLEKDWAYPGSTILDAVFGRGNTIWRFAESSLPDFSGWQTCAVDPKVVSARVAGISHGFCVFDEVGNIWSLKNGEFKYSYFPNRFCYSKEKKKNAPWIEIWTDGEDFEPPEPVSALRTETNGLPAGEAVVSWNTPRDAGGSSTIGFFVNYLHEGGKKEVPRYLIPMAKEYGAPVKMHIQDLPFAPGQTIALQIRSVDGAGNISKPFRQKIKLSSGPKPISLPAVAVQTFSPNTVLPALGNLKVCVVDVLDKIDPVSGRMIPVQVKGYKSGNHIFSGKQKRVRLYGAKNEHVSFQLNVEGDSDNISVTYEFKDKANLNTRLYEFGYVKTIDHKDNKFAVLPDPLIPSSGSFSIPSTAGKTRVEGQMNHSLILEVYIPHDIAPGLKKGMVVVRSENNILALDVDLTVWDFTLPNKLSFVPEMNTYDTFLPFKGYEYYRLAHEHRTCLNRLPYGWDGIPSFAPLWKGDRFEWRHWDEMAAPLLDGSAFNDLPRKGEPVDVMYLPFNENWPVNLFQYYRPSYWADEAFEPEYSEKLQTAFALFVSHLNEKKWFNTNFQFYLNNKIYYRKKDNKSSAPWLFDEPMNTQDFWALRWFGLLWKSAVEPVKGDAKVWYRGDISYSQYERDLLKGVVDIEYIGGNNAQKLRMKKDESLYYKSYFAEYGTANAINDSNLQPVLWSLFAWSNGATGVLPWQTIGDENTWIQGKATSLFYPDENGPIPSVRLKAFRRGQQDVEYLSILKMIFNIPQDCIRMWLMDILEAESTVVKNSFSDAGTIRFNAIGPIDLWKMRCILGESISKYSPLYKRSIVEISLPKFDITQIPDSGHASPAPNVSSCVPECNGFQPLLKARSRDFN